MLQRLADKVSPFSSVDCWYVAYSGGLDSHVLLHMLCRLKKQHSSWPAIEAIHINHQLQDEAAQWSQHCQRIADELSINLHIIDVTINVHANIESQARQLRYAAIQSIVQKNTVVFTGHHQRDQTETFFLRLMRGSGTKGLSSMSQERVLGESILLRPLLYQAYTDLQQYAQQHGLCWIEDPSNQQQKFDRNFIRSTLTPLFLKRWPAFFDVIERVIRHMRESQELLEELACIDLQSIEFGVDELGVDNDAWLSVDKLLLLSASRQKNVLRYWLGLHKVIPSELQLLSIMESVCLARQDASPELMIGSYCVRRYRQRIYLTAIVSGHAPEIGSQQIEWPVNKISIRWQGYELTLSSLVNKVLSIRCRQGGEKISVEKRGTKTVKSLMQEHNIPPWRRQSIPLLYCEGELLLVGELATSQYINKCLGSVVVSIKRVF